MPRYLGLLRAVNVGGTGKLPMAELRRICTEAGFDNVRTYIASGNVVFDSDLDALTARSTIERAVQGWFGQRVPVFLRDRAQMAEALAALPWPDAPGNRVTAIFVDEVGPLDLRHQSDEEVQPGPGVVFAHYPSGMGRSKLVIKGAEQGTARNINTVRKLLEMLS